MRKIIKLISFIFISLLFTSCIDYVQSLSYKDGKYQIYFKCTVSKSIILLAGEDPDVVYGNISKNINNFPKNVITRPINTDLEIGQEIKFSVNPKDATEIEKKYLPKTGKNHIYIPFIFDEDSSFDDEITSDEEDAKEMFQVFLSSAKFRVLVSKKIVPVISTAFFEGKSGQDYSIPVFDYGDSYCLEIPAPVLFEIHRLKMSRIVVVKGE